MSDLIQLAAHHLAEEKRYLAIHGEDEEHPELSRMDHERFERIERFIATPARTLAEIAAKAAVAKVTHDRYGSEIRADERLLQSLFRDMAGAAGEAGRLLIAEAEAINRLQYGGADQAA
jgi:hypothetical protein